VTAPGSRPHGEADRGPTRLNCWATVVRLRLQGLSLAGDQVRAVGENDRNAYTTAQRSAARYPPGHSVGKQCRENYVA